MENVKLVNKTPHMINLICEDGTKISLEPVLPTPRVSSSSVKTASYTITDDEGTEHVITREAPTFGEIVDLPEPEEGVIYGIYTRSSTSSRT